MAGLVPAIHVFQRGSGMAITGGCLCGAVRYTIEAELVGMVAAPLLV